jgi:hypothetical protein
MLTVVAGVALAALGVGGTIAAPSSPRDDPGQCTTKGAPTVLNGQTTTTYGIVLDRVTCAFAKPWVSRLSKKPNVLKNRLPHIAGGPRGFNCYGGRSPTPRTPQGACWGTKSTKSFHWSPYIAGMTG